MKLQEDSMILAPVMYIIVYYYLINTYLPSYFVLIFAEKLKKQQICQTGNGQKQTLSL